MLYQLVSELEKLRRPRVRAIAKPAHVVRGKGFGKIFNFVKKAGRSPLAKTN